MEFKYLEVTIHEKGDQELDINRRTEAVNRLYYNMGSKISKNTEISRETKMKVYKALYRPVLTYACEGWVMLRHWEHGWG